ncbi:ATP-binding protein [Dongia sedimenti]|uniref:histidine kinase n=1 Tax=Dongia sedimenti TaxID=3064282 RepID=A0ABU0YG95_9PROT|nr:PAS domain-containing sensor histidine kinase [Rhodospirillaceae bacterium R-7]
MSIRTFLTLVIAVMGAALLAVAGIRMFSDAERNARANDVVTLAEIGQSLLPTLISSRIERRTAQVALMAAAPADAASWQRLSVHRPITDSMCAQSIAALRTSWLPDAGDLADRLAAAHDHAVAFRSKIDAAIRLPLNQRDPDLLAGYSEISLDYVKAISAAADAVEQATTLFDPEIDRLISLNRSATAARYYTSLITLRMESAVAFDLPWRPKDIVEAAEDQGRADLAWKLVLGVAADPGLPQALLKAIDAAKVSRTSPDADRQAAVILALQAGLPGGLSVSDLQQLNTALLDPLDTVLRESMTEMVTQAKRYQHDAMVSLAVTVTLLFVILCMTGLGIAVVHQRVSRPIRRITRQMSRLKESDSRLETVGGTGSEDDFVIQDAGRNDEIGEMARALIVFRRQVEEHGRRLQEHEMRQFLETLIDAMPVSITFKDTDLRYRYANRSRRHAIVSAIGERPGNGQEDGGARLVGYRLSEVAPGESSALVEAADRELLASGEAQQFEQTRTGPDGKPAIIWSLKTPFRDADGKVTGIITCGVDITRLKQIEAELVAQREKAEAGNRAKIAFLGSMSHELRTPLNAIIGFADMLANGYLGSLDDKQQEYVADIRRSGEHLLKMVNDLLDLSNIEIGRQVLDIGACNFDNVAVAALSMVQPQAEQAMIHLDFQPTDIMVRADERALTQILVNLLGNAIKFSPGGSRIALRAVRQPEGIRIQVEDAGLGMTELQRASALAATLAANPSQVDPYKARPKGGAGLGLAICRRLIEQHNGRLEIESRSGQGSTVHVVLPAA